MTTLTITLPDKSFRTLEKASNHLNLVPDDLARLLLENYLIEKHLTRSKDISKEISEDVQYEASELSLFLQMSQSLLERDWDTQEEDEIWAHL
ncbi:MAG: hypothetical protein ACT6FF_08180 [Methanosarcinaceae archaeon]